MESRSLPNNQREALAAFLDGGVRFLLVGGYAFSAHAFIRATKDIDFWIDPTPENAQRVWNALAKFGAPLTAHSMAVADFHARGLIYQMGTEPQRVDVMTSIADIGFNDAWKRRVEAELDGLRVPVLGLQDLIRSKEAAGRDQDLLDVKSLKRVQARMQDKP